MRQVLDSTGNRLWLVQIPKDGNCLFGSLAHQIYGVTPNNRLFQSYSKQIREITLHEIRSHFDLYKADLRFNANEIVECDWPIEDKIEEYLIRLGTLGFWGGSESLAAASNYFNVCIDVYQATSCIRYEPANGAAGLPVYGIFYSGEGTGVAPHYDSIACKRPHNFTLHPLPNIPTSPIQLADRAFTVDAQVPEPTQNSLVTSVWHQLTGTAISEEDILMLRCLIADELQTQTPSVLASMGVPELVEDLSDYVFRLRLGRIDGGRVFLVLLSSLFKISVYVHSTRIESHRMDPTNESATVAIHLLELDGPYATILQMRQGRRKRISVPNVDPLIVAEKVARTEVHATPELSDPCIVLDLKTGLRFASLNVNGCRAVEKRDIIDFYLSTQNVHIAVLQEVNLQSTDVMTPNYRWYLGQMSGSKKRGLALLIRRGFNVEILLQKNHGPNIQFADVTYQIGSTTQALQIVNVHGPNQNSSGFYAGLGSLVSRLKDPRTLLIAGDFNSQLGSSSLSTAERPLIGKFVGHEHFNDNGEQMRFFISMHQLSVRSTQANASFMQTWKVGNRCSQIDHLLTHSKSFLYLKRMQCTIPGNIPTDHKVLLTNIVSNRSAEATPFLKTPSSTGRNDVDPSLLLNREIRRKFNECLQSYNTASEPDSVEMTWQNLKDKITTATTTILKKSCVPATRECRLALAKVKRCSFWVRRSCHPKWAFKLAEAKSDLKCKLREHDENQIIKFFENLRRYPVGERINRTYKYLKRFTKKKKTNVGSGTRIRLADWNKDECVESFIPAVTLDSSITEVNPPSLEEVKEILSNMKNGKTPGVDNLYSEYYKYCDDQTVEELHQLLVRVFTENRLPLDWKKTIVVPIPKVRHPKTTSEYRQISLSCTAYKIYATWLLRRLQRFVGDIGTHQAAFLPERSTTDHLYVLQRVLQESWNEGKPLVLMSLDIEKAFDQVSLMSLPAILRGKGAPQCFIDRIIECLRGEQQQILWQRQLTKPGERRRGVKQGCPLSPYLFNLIMEAVMESVADEVCNLRLNQEGYISLPLILVFADDVIIVAETIEDVELIVSKIKEYLSYVGLNLNESKCKVLVREPNAQAVEEVTILGRRYKATEPLRYLGVHLTARLERPMTIRTRCRTAVRASHVVLRFLKKYKPSWSVAKVIYESVIAPAMIFGTQTSVLTKYSRKSIRGYERQIVQSMMKLCRDKNLPKSINQLLGKRRITKKIRMYQMRWWGHIRRRPRSHPLRAASRLKSIRLRPCRPSHTWWNSILQTMERYGDVSYGEWKQMATNKDQFHKKLLEIYDHDESDGPESDWETDNEA